MNNVKLQKAITNIYNHLYANSEKKTPHGISKEVGKILHTGMYLEEYTLNKPAFVFTKTEEKNTLEKNNKAFSKSIHLHFKDMNDKWAIYDKSDTIKLKDFDIAYTCIQLNGIEITNPKKDVFGDSLEIFRSQWAKQAGGQFFTDSLVTRLSMKLLEFDPRKGDDLIDICSGTGGFLLAGLNHIKSLLDIEKVSKKDIEKEIVELARKSIYGQEFDKEVCSIANSTLKSRTGDNSHTFVTQGDSLEKEYFSNSKNRIKFNSHKCIAGNPPFGTKITIKDTNVLENYELARVKARQNDNSPSKITSRAPDILFLEQNVKLLVPGEGRLSLVVPYQILSGPQTLYIRKWLLKNTIITSVIDLPADTFQPHTGTKGCLLTLVRRKEPITHIDDLDDYNIFMSTPKWIGHDRRGNPVFKKTIEGIATDEILTDFPEVEKAYSLYLKGENFEKIHQESFIVSLSDILETSLFQLNAQFHKTSHFDNKQFNKKDWHTYKLKDLTERIFYPGRFSRGYVEYYPGAIPFYGGKEIIQMVTDGTKWISHNHYKIKELEVKTGWILITRSGTTGVVSIVPDAWNGYAMSEHVIRVVPKKGKISPFYLLAYLKTKYCQNLIAKGVYGSVIDSITPEYIGNIEIMVPKDKKMYESIVKKSEMSELERNNALTHSQESINALNDILVN
ncbi:N-6 DNA methylase [Olleya marilimosa]|uniref:N-6 DNA methylase n=1 Tax=Olleya marilimosa TaxID=272164 RepID=UPI00168D27E9|nr:N-6 DNA methylase [Olleya marilimosa]MBD3892164.1 N-6 DNA methylase [Olleya marilimosa]